MISEEGEIEFAQTDDANVPVDIWLSQVGPDDEDAEHAGLWCLTAGNYCPRKGAVAEAVYTAYADSFEELVPLLEQHVIPLYERALKALKEMAKGTRDSLYYWSEK